MSKEVSLAANFEKIRADYDMSRDNRFVRKRTGLAALGGPADYHYRNENAYYRDIEKARDMDRNDAIVGQTVDRAVANIVQDGFSLDVKTGDKKLSAELKARWQQFAEDPEACDIAEEFTWQDIERHCMRAMLLDGDIAAMALDTGQLQLLEAHTIRNTSTQKNTFCGVTLNDYRKRETFWVLKDGPTPYQNIEIAEPKQVRDTNGNRQIFHVYNPKRTTQTRGITSFAPIFALTGMFEDIQFAKLVQQQVVSCFAVFRQRSFNPDGSSPPSTPAGYGETKYDSNEYGVKRLEGVSPGMELIGQPGETLQGFSPNTPNAEYFNHVRLMLQLIGVNLGLPLCLVLMDGSETNFSGWRGAVDEARKGFTANQRNLVKRLHLPVYRWKVRQWMAEDPAIERASRTAKVDIYGHKWNSPTWSYIDPMKDAQADAFQVQNALTSPRRLHGSRGRDWDEIANEIVEDNATAIIKAKKRAERINRAVNDGQPVHWRELISLPMPSGLKMDLADPKTVEESPIE